MKADKDFHKTTPIALKERVGEKWEKYSLESLLDTVFAIAEIESDPNDSEWFVSTETLVSIFRQERNKIEKGERQKLINSYKPKGKGNKNHDDVGE